MLLDGVHLLSGLDVLTKVHPALRLFVVELGKLRILVLDELTFEIKNLLLFCHKIKNQLTASDP